MNRLNESIFLERNNMKSRRDMFVWVLKHPRSRANVSKDCDPSWELSYTELLFMCGSVQLPSALPNMHISYACIY